MEDNRDGNNQPSTHSQYTEAYVGILNAYKEQLNVSVKEKNSLKRDFFKAIRFIMIAMVFIFGIVLLAALIVMGIMATHENPSIEILAGAIVSIISSFVTMILGLYKLPQIIADYLFNKEEDKQMTEIIVNIQKYELDVDKTEKLRNQAQVDAAISQITTIPDADEQINNSSYVDSSKEDKIEDQQDNKEMEPVKKSL